MRYSRQIPLPRAPVAARLAVAQAKHFEQPGLGLRRPKEPILHIGFDALAHQTGEAELSTRQ